MDLAGSASTVRVVSGLVKLVAALLAVAALARGRAVLLPIAFAVVLAFILTPPMKWLQRHLSRLPALTLVMLLAVGALGTVYALSTTGEDVAGSLAPIIGHSWSLATALSLLAWYVFAPQCLSTLSVVRRETGSIRYAFIMAGYMFALAYAASFITFHAARALLGG